MLFILFKILLLTTLFSFNNAIRQYHETSVSRTPTKQEQNTILRNIDFKAFTSYLEYNIPATTLGLAIASWTIIYKNVPKKKSNQDKDNDVEPLTEEDVIKCQKDWSNAIELISSSYLHGEDFVDTAIKTAGELYGYEHLEVLFKPTKATNHPFRATGDEAMSYFVGAENFMNSEKFKGEDIGFAINGGKGWKKVVFKNHKIYLDGNTALAMGSYEFTCATTGETTRAEFTFGYKRCPDGKPRIFLHHSSVPYQNLYSPVEQQKTFDTTNNELEGKSKVITSEGHTTHIHIYTRNMFPKKD